MKVRGFILCIIIATFSLLLSLLHPAFEALAISIIAGILLGNILIKNDEFNRGISLALKIFLPLGIFLYGSQLTLDWQEASCCGILVVIPLILLFLITLFLSKITRVTGNTGILMATGISICGASAIAILSAVVKAKKNEISIAIISIIAIGIIAIGTYPLIREILALSPEDYAFLVGATVPTIGQVKIAAGPDLSHLALSIKLLRVGSLAILIPLVIIFKKGSRERLYIPWFIVGFIGLAIAFNMIEDLTKMRVLLAPVSTFSLATALSAIGLEVDLESMGIEGLKPLFALLTSWVLVVILVLFYLSYIAHV